MGVADLVKVTHYLLRAEDIKPYVAVRSKFLGDARPVDVDDRDRAGEARVSRRNRYLRSQGLAPALTFQVRNR